MADFQLRFLSDISQTVNELGKLSKEVSKSTDGINKKFSSINTTFLNISSAVNIAQASFAALSGVFSRISYGISTVINDASNFEESVNELRTALNLSGIESETVVTRLTEFAGALQSTTRFSDDAILGSASLIQSLGQLTEQGLERATKAALDLSTSLRIDLQTAATLVGKAASGEVGSFSRYGIKIKEAETQAKTFENALRAIESRFGGSSESAVRTYAGAIDQLSNNFSDILKEIGLGIIRNRDFISSINTLSAALVEVVPLAVSFGESIGKITVKSIEIIKNVFSELPAIILAATFALTAWNAQLILTTGASIISGLRVIVTSFSTLASLSAVLVAPFALLALKIVAIGAAAAGIYVLAKRFFEARGEAKKLNDELNKPVSINDLVPPKFARTIETEVKLKLDSALDLEKPKEEFKKFSEEIIKNTSSISEKAIATAKESKAKLEEYRKLGIVTEEQYNNLSLRIQKKKFEDEQREATKASKEAIENQRDRLLNAGKGLVLTIIDGFNGGVEKLSGTGFAGIALALANGIAGGVEGARDTLVGIGEAIGGLFGEGFGTVVGQLVRNLSATTEEFTNKLTEGFRALPKLLSNIFGNIPDLFIIIAKELPAVITEVLEKGAPAFVEELISAIPTIIQALIEALPSLIRAFVTSAPLLVVAVVKGVVNLIIGIIEIVIKRIQFYLENLGRILNSAVVRAANSFATSIADSALNFSKNILDGAGQFVQKIIEGGASFVKELSSKIASPISNAPGGGIVSTLKNLRPFAEGGVVPGGFPNDSFPARLTSGEAVISPGLTQKLDKFLNDSGGNTRVGNQNLTVNLQVGEQELASVLLNLNRRGFRFA